MQKHFQPERFICLDESSAKTNMTRGYGWSKIGERCYDKAPHGHWKTITMLSSIWHDGKTETIVYDGSTTKKIFEAYIEKCLLPHIKKGDIVVMDNLSAHKSAKVKELIEKKKAWLMYLPPYSPDLNPIEHMWSKVKSVLRKIKATTVNELHDAIATALDSITKKDANNWFENCGYIA